MNKRTYNKSVNERLLPLLSKILDDTIALVLSLDIYQTFDSELGSFESI